MPTVRLDADHWVDKHSDYLFNYTITRVNDADVAKDLVQETFLAALKSMGNFKGNASERTWLIAILKRKIIDFYRKSNSKKEKAEVRMAYASGATSDQNWIQERVANPFDTTMEQKIENKELGLAILNCIGRLPEKQARIFKMKTMQDFDTESICKEFEITTSNLWVIIHRARTAMSKCLKEKWF